MLPRRKRPGFGVAKERDYGNHGPKIRHEVGGVLDAYKKKPKINETNPALILKLQLSGYVGEDVWEDLNLHLLGDDPDQTLILFASDNELTEFRRRIDRYNEGVPENKKIPHMRT